MKNKKLPAWVEPGVKIIYFVGYTDKARVETITRVTETSAWSVDDDSYAEGSPNRRETRWVSDGSYAGDVLERYGSGQSYRYTFAYALDSERGRVVLARSQKDAALREIQELMESWKKEKTDHNSMKLRQALARWEIKYADKVDKVSSV